MDSAAYEAKAAELLWQAYGRAENGYLDKAYALVAIANGYAQLSRAAIG